MRRTSPLDQAQWEPVPADTPPWPPYDPAWTWFAPDLAVTAWDQRWGKDASLPKERQREALLQANRSEWLTATKLRASVRGWLQDGPEVALREARGSSLGLGGGPGHPGTAAAHPQAAGEYGNSLKLP